MKAIKVDLGKRSYDIHLAHGGLRLAGELLDGVMPHRVVIVSNPTVAAHYLDTLRLALEEKRRQVECFLIPDGEAHKNARTLECIYTRLIELGVERDSALIALGGGVVGDITGYAAATYQRGIDFIQIPTTLLAQVDSSVGGKTGINHALGKNLVGAFHQPRAVLIDPSCLVTLPAREFSAGLAEVIKCGLIRDADFFEWIERNVESVMRLDPTAIERIIAASCSLKAEIVGSDERESGSRALLNFGHTFGHAIEAGLGYGNWLHGEAVAAGMVLAGELSHRLARLDATSVRRIRSILEAVNLPTRAPRLSERVYAEQLRRDKKTKGGCARFVLLDSIGSAKYDQTVDNKVLSELMAEPSLFSP